MKVSFPGIICVLFAALFLTLMATCVKLATNVSNETLIFFRNLISFIGLLPFFIHGNFPIRTKRLPLHFLRAALGLSAIYCYFFTVKYLDLTVAVLLQNTVPLFIPLVVLVFLKLKVPLRRLIAVSFGFIGIIFIIRPGEKLAEWASLTGVLGGVFGACALVAVRRLTKTENTKTILFYNFLFSILISLFPMIAAWTPVIGIKNWLWILLVGIFALVYQFFLTKAYTLIPATKAASLMYIGVVYGGIIDWLVWGNIPGKWVILGSSLVIAGGVSAILDASEAVPLKKKGKLP